jgi:hypothetical protein
MELKQPVWKMRLSKREKLSNELWVFDGEYPKLCV